MGNTFGLLRKSTAQPSIDSDVHVEPNGSARTSGFPLSLLKRTRKRRATDESKPELSTPAKIIKLDTPNYLFQRLFIHGFGSDIVVAALGREWVLHRVYLEQCEYFRCLFNGQWSDSKTNRIDLEILDRRITIAGLNSVFGSLYQNELTFDLKDIGGILSAATLFNLVACIERCEDLMLSSVNDENVVEYYELSVGYGVTKCRDRCIAYLTNMFWRLARRNTFLQQLSYELLELILNQWDLCVTEGERDVYTAIKRWIYIHENKKTEFTADELHSFVVSKPPRYFYKYQGLLKHVRFQHMITGEKTLVMLKTERIIDNDLLSSIIADQWTSMLLYEEKAEMLETIPDLIFNRCCRRVGRPIDEDKCWRWSGFDFGLDLLFRCQYGVISMLRNHSRDLTNQSLSMRRNYRLHYRLIILDERGKIFFDSERKTAEMSVDQKVFIGKYPVTLKTFSVHFFYLSAVPGQSAQEYWTNTSPTTGLAQL